MRGHGRRDLFPGNVVSMGVYAGWGQNKMGISWRISLQDQTNCVGQKENRQTNQLTKSIHKESE